MLRLRPTTLSRMQARLDEEHLRVELHASLAKLSPTTVELLGDAGLDRCILEATNRARAHGVANRGLLRFYVELAFMFGTFFDADPLLPWASRALGDARSRDEGARIAGLYRAMTRYLDEAESCDPSSSTHAYAAAAALLDGESWQHPLGDAAAAELLTSLAPRRARWLGESVVASCVRRAHDEALAVGLPLPRGRDLLAILAFTLGSGCAHDPIYPWLSADRALFDARVGGDARETEIERRFRAFLATHLTRRTS